jgi:hypothetical protein
MSSEPFFEFDKSTLIQNDTEWSAIQNISQIAPYIYIGSFETSTQKSVLEKHAIRYVLQLDAQTKTAPILQLYANMGIRHMQIALSDDPNADLRLYMERIYAYVKKAVAEKRNVMVQDAQGVNVSAAAVAYYIIRSLYEKGQKPQQTILTKLIETMVGKRNCIHITENYISQLHQAELYLRGSLGQQRPWM